MPTNHKRAWSLFERRRKAAMETFDYMNPEEGTTEEALFLAVMEEVYGSPRKSIGEPRGRGVHE